MKDAVNICIQKLRDYQLALVVSKLTEGETSNVYQNILRDHVIPESVKNSDRALTSIGYWLLKEYENSMYALVPPTERAGAEEALILCEEQGSSSSAGGSPSMTSPAASPYPNRFGAASSSPGSSSPTPQSSSFSLGRPRSRAKGATGSEHDEVRHLCACACEGAFSRITDMRRSSFPYLVVPGFLSSLFSLLQARKQFDPTTLYLFNTLRKHPRIKAAQQRRLQQVR